MSEGSPVTQAPPPPGALALRLAKGELVGPTLCRVVAIVLARAGYPLDRIDDALILCDALTAHAPAYTRDHHISFSLTSEPSGAVELRVAELRERGASSLLRDALVPEVGNPIERFSTAQRIEPDSAGGETLVLTLGVEG